MEHHLLSRAELEFSSADDPVGSALLAETQGYATRSTVADSQSAPRPGDVLLPIHLRTGDLDLRLFTTIVTLSTPQDVTLQELRAETWLPSGIPSVAGSRISESEPL